MGGGVRRGAWAMLAESRLRTDETLRFADSMLDASNALCGGLFVGAVGCKIGWGLNAT
jgi:hypothetical protein